MNLIDQALLFITLAIPKAGTKIGSIPLYLSFLSMSYFFIKGATQASRSKLCAILILFFALTITLITTINSSEITQSISSDQLIYLIPISLFPIYFSGKDIAQKRKGIRTIILLSFLIVSLYGILQKILGDYTVVIPGVTANLAEAADDDFLSKKSNMIWGLNILKLTSTYQNGNVFGVNYLLISGISIAILKQLNLNKHLLIFALLIFPVTLLTGSASAYFGLAVGIIYFSLFSDKNGPALKSILPIAIVTLIFITLISTTENPISEIFSDRILNRDIGDGGGRAEKILTYINTLEANPAAIFTGLIYNEKNPPQVYEVLPAAVLETLGIFGLIFFLYLIFILLRTIAPGPYRTGFYAYLFASFSDGAFWTPPTSVNLFLLMGIASTLSHQKPPNTSGSYIPNSHNSNGIPQ